MAAGFASELFTLTSAYRSSSKQARLSATARGKYGSRENAKVFVAEKSEHITGRAMDLNLGISNSGANALARRFDDLPEYQWLKENAAQFGFNPYAYSDGTHPGEPWHWSYNTR
jgi:LAS superfamily LD-carboxypeptidase LdcB